MDQRVLFTALVFLGVTGVIAVGGMVLLAMDGREIPPALAAVVGTTLGTVGGLLSLPRQRGE